MKPIALVSNTTWYVYNFRLNLALEMRKQGLEVLVIAPFDKYTPKLEELGFTCVDWQLNRRGVNPFEDFIALFNLYRIYRAYQPAIVHHFTIKCCLYGTLACFWDGTMHAVNSVTGLGHAVLSDSPKFKLIRPILLRLWANTLGMKCSNPIFQNEVDLGLLSAYAPRLRSNSFVSAGSGVNLDYFQPVPLTDRNPFQLRVVFAGRLIEEKGIREFVAAAKAVPQEHPSVTFVACGEIDYGNRSAINADDLAEWEQEGHVEFPGHVSDIRQTLREADMFVLPSYREGLSRVLLEASAMGLPIVATNVPGCREVVTSGRTGLLVPPRDSESLASAITQLVESPEKRTEFGQNAREKAELLFDERFVINDILELYRQLTPKLLNDANEQAQQIPTRDQVEI